MCYFIKDNASGSEDLNEFQSKYDEYLARYEKLNKELADLKAELDRKQKQKMQIRLFIEQYKKT